MSRLGGPQKAQNDIDLKEKKLKLKEAQKIKFFSFMSRLKKQF